MKNTHGGELLLVKLQAESWNFTKNNLHWCFSCFLNCTNSAKSRKTSHLFCQKCYTLWSQKYKMVPILCFHALIQSFQTHIRARLNWASNMSFIGGWWNEDVRILKNFASSFLKLLKQGIVYVIESRWHVI